MVLIVEDGSIVAGADSYVSVADTDTYNTSYVGGSLWIAAIEAAKEIALRQATQYLDVTYYDLWLGERVDDTQALSWPRSGVYYSDGVAVGADEIPEPLKKATMELAIKANASPNSLFTDVSAGASGVKREKVKAGPVEADTTYNGSSSTQTRYTIVDNLIAPLTYANGYTERT